MLACCWCVYLLIPHTGKFVFNCVSCACKMDARPAASHPFKARRLFLWFAMESTGRPHRIEDAGREEWRIRETTLRRSRISQLIFECCCCYFFFFFRAELYQSPNPELCGGAKKKGWEKRLKLGWIQTAGTEPSAATHTEPLEINKTGTCCCELGCLNVTLIISVTKVQKKGKSITWLRASVLFSVLLLVHC